MAEIRKPGANSKVVSMPYVFQKRLVIYALLIF